MSIRELRNFIFQATKMTFFQKFDFDVHTKVDTGREIVEGFGYKVKVSRSSFRMHMRNQGFSVAKPLINECPENKYAVS